MLEILGLLASSLLGTVFKKMFPDKSQNEIEQLIKDVEPEINQAIQASLDKAQAAITEKEANSIYKFVAYTRPTLLWFCIIMFIYGAAIVPLLQYIVHYFFGHNINLPQFNQREIGNLLCAMLGIGMSHGIEYLKRK